MSKMSNNVILILLFSHCSLKKSIFFLKDIKTQRGSQQTKKPNYHDVRDLVTLRDFTAQSADDISVMGGEQVFADLANQIEREWLWVYAPSTGKYGYIPRDNVVHADRSPIPTESELRNFSQKSP